jgi:hypothetical protein
MLLSGAPGLFFSNALKTRPTSFNMNVGTRFPAPPPFFRLYGAASSAAPQPPPLPTTPINKFGVPFQVQPPANALPPGVPKLFEGDGTSISTHQHGPVHQVPCSMFEHFFEIRPDYALELRKLNKSAMRAYVDLTTLLTESDQTLSPTEFGQLMQLLSLPSAKFYEWMACVYQKFNQH